MMFLYMAIGIINRFMMGIEVSVIMIVLNVIIDVWCFCISISKFLNGILLLFVVIFIYCIVRI